MDAEVFAEKLENIVRRYNDELTILVHQAQIEEFGSDGWNTPYPLTGYPENWKIDDAISNIIGHGAWVHDRIRGLNRLSKRGSLQKRVRKLLGFTYP